ncbi:MAG TPA: hypothetical protein VGI67_05440 [Thermoleophilaceae bacterium]
MSEREHDPLDEQVEDLERRNEQLGEHIEEVRKDWETKKSDESVPGAVEDEDDES